MGAGDTVRVFLGFCGRWLVVECLPVLLDVWLVLLLVVGLALSLLAWLMVLLLAMGG